MNNERSEAAVVEEAKAPAVEDTKTPPKASEPDYTAQIAALKVAALQIHLHGNS